MLSKTIKTYKDVMMVGGVFVEGKVNYLYGENGVGKTVSTIKALNADGVTPILLDYDDNMSPEQNECEYIHVNGKIVTTKDEIVKDSVVVIDTYHYMDEEVMKLLSKNNNTIIIIGHPKGIATKQDIPDAPDEFVNHCASKLYLSYAKKADSYDLTVMKCRGYRGDKVITNWMRHDKYATES